MSFVESIFFLSIYTISCGIESGDFDEIQINMFNQPSDLLLLNWTYPMDKLSQRLNLVWWLMKFNVISRKSQKETTLFYLGSRFVITCVFYFFSATLHQPFSSSHCCFAYLIYSNIPDTRLYFANSVRSAWAWLWRACCSWRRFVSNNGRSAFCTRGKIWSLSQQLSSLPCQCLP